MDSAGDYEAAFVSISSCISVLEGDLQQPGTPAIVLKLAASWEKLKSYLLPQDGADLKQEEHVSTDSSVGTVGGEGTDTTCVENRTQAAASVDDDSDVIIVKVVDMATQLTSNSESGGQGIASESHETESSGLLLMKYQLDTGIYSLLLSLFPSPI